MSLTYTELQEAGENGRSAGYSFEDIIKNEINNQTQIGKNIIKFILEHENISSNQIHKIEAEKTPKNVDNILGGRKTAPKADIFLNIYLKDNSIKKIGISIKSSPASIQVQITNVDKFKEICEYYQLEFPDILYKALSKFCGFGQFKPSKEEKENLKQGGRDRWLYSELSKEEQQAIRDFFTKNERDIIEIVLRKGSTYEEFFADYYIVNKTAYSQTNEIDICIKKMDQVIEDSIGGFIETPQGSFHIGKITVQMKGSGKGEAKHGLQFNKKGC